MEGEVISKPAKEDTVKLFRVSIVWLELELMLADGSFEVLEDPVSDFAGGVGDEGLGAVDDDTFSKFSLFPELFLDKRRGTLISFSSYCTLSTGVSILRKSFLSVFLDSPYPRARETLMIH